MLEGRAGRSVSPASTFTVTVRGFEAALHQRGKVLSVATDDAKAVLQELAPLDGIIQSIRQALNAPKAYMNNTTWKGSAADAWRADWEARAKAIEAFLESAQAESNRLRRSLQGK
jgi:hypothetical protein